MNTRQRTTILDGLDSDWRYTEDKLARIKLEGVTNLLERLRAGERVPLPEGVTPETLKKYADLAKRAIQDGKDTLCVQRRRQEAIDLLLKQLGIR